MIAYLNWNGESETVKTLFSIVRVCGERERDVYQQGAVLVQSETKPLLSCPI